MKVYEMLQAMELTNQLNVALGQNEQCLKIFFTNKDKEDEGFHIYAMNQRQYYEKAVKHTRYKEMLLRVAAMEYDPDSTSFTYNYENWDLEIYSGYDWEIDD